MLAVVAFGGWEMQLDDSALLRTQLDKKWVQGTPGDVSGAGMFTLARQLSEARRVFCTALEEGTTTPIPCPAANEQRAAPGHQHAAAPSVMPSSRGQESLELGLNSRLP